MNLCGWALLPWCIIHGNGIMHQKTEFLKQTCSNAAGLHAAFKFLCWCWQLGSRSLFSMGENAKGVGETSCATWIEVNNNVSKFGVDGQDHLEMIQIYTVLERFNIQSEARCQVCMRDTK